LLSLLILLSTVGYCGTVTDEAGRLVAVPEYCKRIVSLAPSITEILFALGAGNRVVGVSQFSNYPVQARKVAKVGSYVYPNLERIVALQPDLVIGTRDGNPKVLVERLSELGIPVFVTDPKNLEEITVTVTNIGRVIGAEEAASSLARQMTRRIHQVEARVCGEPRPKVFFQIGIEPVISAGRGTFIDVLIRKAGGLNIAASSSGYPRFNIERVLVAQPQVIIITSMARGFSFEKAKQFWQQWPQIPAVKHKLIYPIDSDICDRPSPRIVDGLETLARIIHPERFP